MELPSTRRTIRFDDYLLDSLVGRLQIAGRTVALRPKAFEVLFYLAQRSGHVVSKEELLRAIWPNLVVTDDSLVQCVSEIRRALNDDRQQIIRTLPRRGYIFTRSIAEAGDSSAGTNRQPARLESVRLEAGEPSPAAVARGVGAPPPAVAVPEREIARGPVKALLARVRRMIDALRGRESDAFANVPFFTIAVLPLRSTAPTDEIYARQLTDQLTLAVSRIPGSFVIARNTVEGYEGRSVDPKQVGRELGVRYVVQGNVDRALDKSRLILDLVDTHTGQQVWAERFDHIDDLVIDTIARGFNLKLYDIEAERRRRERPDAPRFDDLIVRAFSLVERQTAETVEQARQLGFEAARLEPRGVGGWVVLAFTYFIDLANRWCDLSMRKEWTKRGCEAAAKAYALNPDDFHTIGVWAWALEARGRLEEAAAAVERQIAMNPSFTVAFHRRAYLKMLMGQPEAAIELEQQVLRFTPIGNIIHNAYSTIAISLIHLGRDAEALEAALNGAAARPVYANTYAYLAAAAGNLGDMPRARAALAEFRRFLPKYTITAFREEKMSERPAYLAQREHFYDGLRKAGLEE